MYTLGIDIGSTTVKVAVLDKDNKILFSDYKRHFANIKETLKDLVQEAKDALGENEVNPCITGSGGLALAQLIGVPFTQEVVCVSEALQDYAPQTDVAIELGGEDAKIIYFTNGIEQRMNGVCAGGTGSFIDQMATLLQTDASGLNDYAKDYDTIYPIAARCGVFAKTDIQPLINEGATKPNLAASIFQAVVNQTISGLACGKPIKGNVAFLGGPLHFLPELKNAFIRTLNLTGDAIIDPGHSHLFAAVGAAMNSKPEVSMTLSELIHALSQELNLSSGVERLAPLFESDEDYEKFKADHNKYAVKRGDLATYKGNCFIGVDAGSTTTKVALVGSDGELLYDFYSSNNGSPLNTTIRAIKDIYSKLPEYVSYFVQDEIINNISDIPVIINEGMGISICNKDFNENNMNVTLDGKFKFWKSENAILILRDDIEERVLNAYRINDLNNVLVLDDDFVGIEFKNLNQEEMMEIKNSKCLL